MYDIYNLDIVLWLFVKFSKTNLSPELWNIYFITFGLYSSRHLHMWQRFTEKFRYYHTCCLYISHKTHTHSNTCIAYLFCIIMYLDANCANILQINQKQVRKKLGKYSYLTSTINTHSSQCGILLSDFYFILYFRFSHCFFLQSLDERRHYRPPSLHYLYSAFRCFYFVEIAYRPPSDMAETKKGASTKVIGKILNLLNTNQ